MTEERAASGAHLGLHVLATVLDEVAAGVVVLDPELRVHVWNRWMEEHSEIEKSDVIGKRLPEVFPEFDFRALRRRMKQALTLGQAAFFDARVDGLVLPLPNDQRLVRRFPLMRQDGVVAPLAAQRNLVCLTISDQTSVVTAELQLAESHALLEHQSRFDDLTEIWSRRYLLERIGTALEETRRNGDPFSLSVVDIDYFKSVNDRFGHQIGDRALVAVARALREAADEHDLVGRYGGEEFLVAMPTTPLDRARERAEEIRRRVAAESVPVADRLVSVTVSFGLAVSRPPHDVDSLLHRADDALYRAKRSGRNRIEIAR